LATNIQGTILLEYRWKLS